MPLGPERPAKSCISKSMNPNAELCNRLNADEDPDVEAIGDCFWEINRVLCLLMYRLGAERDSKN